MPIETSSIHTNSVSARVLHPSRSEQIPGAGEIILGLEESESRRGRRDEQMYTDGITVNPVNNPSWLEHFIIHPTRPERSPRAGEIIWVREESKPSGEGKTSRRMSLETPSISFIMHLNQSGESFIRLGSNGFPRRGRYSRAAKGNEPSGGRNSEQPYCRLNHNQSR